VFTTAVGCELRYPIQTIESMKNFQNKVIYEEFGKQAPLEILSNCMVGTEHFYKQYKEAANWYAKYNSEKT
jgi:hypothetical protein